MVKVRKSITVVEGNKIRRQFDQKNDKWFFSIVDIIEMLGETSDARNYWKVLKNRLKKGQNELVTKCNQLKMLARDGKFYLTDVADAETSLGIIKLVSPSNLEIFRQWIDSPLSKEENLLIDEAKLLIDGYQTDTDIYIKTMVAGVDPALLSISVTPSKVTIKGRRQKLEKISDHDYLEQELLWSNFSRTISLPARVKTDEVETSTYNGELTIKLKKIV